MKSAGAKIAESIILSAAIGCAVALIWPHVVTPPSQRHEHLARKGGEIILSALESYSEKHKGIMPDPSRVTGGTSMDILIEEKCLTRYPENPYSYGTPMKNVSPDGPSPGNFSYQRNPEKHYAFRLSVYGEDGIVFEYKSDLF